MSDLLKTVLPLPKLELGTLVVPEVHLVPTLSAPANFRFGEVSSTALLNPAVLATVAPSLGPLAAFVGDWEGHGFNTIFRPNSPQTPTHFPVPPTDPQKDNVLELNLTAETLSFSPSIGSVPNRGTVQADAFLNGVPYRQTVNDVTTAGTSIGIHVEPGLWMAVPATTDPAEGPTVSRMGSIPHGTTINAQGTSKSFAGKPTIPSVGITPVILPAGTPVRFPSQTAASKTTMRIPQDLSPWIAANTITQAMLDDPNVVLRNAIAGQTILNTTQISITTNPGLPILLPATPPPQPSFGGGTDNIAFLDGDAAIANPNAQTTQMEAIFWIETVQHVLHIPIFQPGQPALKLTSVSPVAGHPGQAFTVTPPRAITVPRTITFTTTQIQYTQLVVLVFAGLAWPHVSVATLTPSGGPVVPPSAWN